MRKEREALLIAALAGLVIVGAAAFVVQPTIGAGHQPPRIQLSQVPVAGTPLSADGTTVIFRTV